MSIAYGSKNDPVIHAGTGRGVKANSTDTTATAINPPRTNPKPAPISRSSQESPVHLNSFDSSFPISPPNVTHATNTSRNPTRFETATEFMNLWIHAAGMP